MENHEDETSAGDAKYYLIGPKNKGSLTNVLSIETNFLFWKLFVCTTLCKDFGLELKYW